MLVGTHAPQDGVIGADDHVAEGNSDESRGRRQKRDGPVDLSAGEEQEYVEDCPVCCRPHLIHVEIDEDGDVRVWAERE